MNRQQAIDEVAKCVLADRNRDYGDPEDNFKTTAQIWNAYLQGRGLLAPGKALESFDVAALMMGLKFARLVTSPAKADTWVDLAGYAVCGVECATKGEVKPIPGVAIFHNDPVRDIDA